MFTIDEINSFFTEAGWGQLTEEKTSKKEAFYLLENPGVPIKVANRNFQLEAGFLAEQFQKINGMLTECYAKPNASKHSVVFHIAWDRKSSI